MPLVVEAGVDRRLGAAGTHRLDLGDGLGDLEQPLAPREEVGREVGRKPETQHGNVPLDDDIRELIHLPGRQKLALVHDDDVAIGLFTATVIVAALSMVCYVLYYHLADLVGYVDGMIPLLLAGVFMAILAVFIICNKK